MGIVISKIRVGEFHGGDTQIKVRLTNIDIGDSNANIIDLIHTFKKAKKCKVINISFHSKSHA